LRRQRHLTWAATHDVVSREINIWKSFDLTASPPELTARRSCLIEVWGKDPWLSLIGDSHLVLISVIMMMGEMAVV